MLDGKQWAMLRVGRSITPNGTEDGEEPIGGCMF